MGFLREREIVEIKEQSEFEELTELEDLELHIKGTVHVKKDIEITDCNVLFYPGSKMELKGGKTAFNDCEIVFPEDISASVITGKGGNLVFDFCDIYQSESSGKEKAAFIASNISKKIIEMSNCKIHDMNGMLIQSNGSSVYIEKTEIHNFTGKVVDIQKGTGGFSPAFVLSECSFKKCHERTNEIYLIKIGHIISGKIEKCHFENCSIGCINADGNGWDDTERDSRNCPFVINYCTFKKCDSRKDKFLDNDKKTIVISRFNTIMINCKFHKCAGVNIHAQLAETLIENCEFKGCKSESVRDGILSIVAEAYEKIIYIRNCKFEKCIVGKDYEQGIIFLGSGFADKDQKETVTIEKCSFRECIGNEIRGIERDDGFFGKSVKLYVMKS